MTEVKSAVWNVILHTVSLLASIAYRLLVIVTCLKYLGYL
jgi:hypothetical protein